MNPTALITGASRGIGRGIALELAKIGWDLVVNYANDFVAATKTANDCFLAAAAVNKTIHAMAVQADVGTSVGRWKLVDFTRQNFQRLDLLVNNAGISSIGRADLLDATEENFDKLMAVNLKGPFFLTQLAAIWMIEQSAKLSEAAPPQLSSDDERQPFGVLPPQILQTDEIYRPKIITISSISAYTASTNRGDYCVAKAALGMMTQLFAVRLAEHGINVYEIRPGIIATDMTAPVKEKYDKLIAEGLTPIPRWGTPEDVGRAVAAIAQNLLPFSTGEVINVDGGFHLRRL